MEKSNPPFDDFVRMRVVVTVPGMDTVRVRRDGVYRTVDGQSLCADVYVPSGPRQLRPAVVLIHGGPIPRLGARKMGVFVSYGELIAASGFVAVAFDHRFLSPARIGDAADDVRELLTFVRTNADDLGVDARRLSLWAFSGGGPFLAQPLRERPPWLRAAVAYYAILDLQQPPPGSEGMDSESLRTFSAVDALGSDASGAPPMLIARAGLDNAWLNGTIDRFVQRALDRGARLDLLNHPAGRHSFDILDDDVRSREIIRRTLAFLRDCLEPTLE
jgi:acetyl esterase/lipase